MYIGEDRDRKIREAKALLKERLGVPYFNNTDKGLTYVRYADDCAPRRRKLVA